MGTLTGSSAKAGMKLSTTWGTAVQCGAGDKLSGVTITHSENTDELTVPAIGSGLDMKGTTDRGGIDPIVILDGPLAYNDPRVVALAQMFGAASVTSLAGGNGSYQHSIMYNAATQSKFLTCAFQLHSAVAGAIEYPSAVCRKATLSGTAKPDYINLNMELLANKQELATAVNTFANLNLVTDANTKRVPFEFADEFWINAQAGAALASGDRLNITNFSFTYERGMEHANEAKGSAGNGQPVAAGEYPFITGLQVTARTLADFTYFTAHQAETEYKACLIKTGPAYNGGSWTYKWIFYFPRLKLVTPPENNLTSAAANPLTLNFQALVASANPAGQVSQYPHIVLQNDRSANLLA